MSGVDEAEGWYNGLDLAQRRATLRAQRDAIRSGQLAEPTECSICGLRAGGTERLQRIGYHDEDYAEVLAAYPVCGGCHQALHRRFERPGIWKRLIRMHGDGRQWFELLSLDPATRTRPFKVSYAKGLPPPRPTIKLHIDLPTES